MVMRDGDPQLPRSGSSWLTSPLAALIVVALAFIVFAYNFGNQPSNSEKYGTISESEAQDGVTPSLPPDGGTGSSESSNTASALP
jgi:hypothetical protein